VSEDRRYASPTDFRRALTGRLRALSQSGPWTLPQLQRQIAYDRLLERLYGMDDGWVLKGATALLARDIGVRGTIDVDLYRLAAQQDAQADLRRAVAVDIGDWFNFEIRAPRPIAAAGPGLRLPVVASIGGTVWTEFHIDLVGVELRMTGVPDRVPPLAQVTMPDVEQHGYRAYPLVDHAADKIVAILERYGAISAPSTRYKDLVDLVAIVTSSTVDAAAQQIALRSEADRRGVVLHDHFDVPDYRLWERGYAAEAGRSLLTTAKTLDDALAVVKPFIDPLLDGDACGRWNPSSGQWRDES
jgi:hypothetical protein